MDLIRLVIAGAVGGFLSIFTSWLITGHVFHRFQRLTPETWRPEGPKQYALSTLMQTLEGAAVGVFFYATGGISTAGPGGWLVRGFLFGGLGWLALVCPTILGSAIYVRLHRGVVAGLLLDSLLAVLFMSWGCAWAVS